MFYENPLSLLPVPKFTQSLPKAYPKLQVFVYCFNFCHRIAITSLSALCSVRTQTDAIMLISCFRISIICQYEHWARIQFKSASSYSLNMFYLGYQFFGTATRQFCPHSTVLCAKNIRRSHNFQNKGLAACWGIIILLRSVLLSLFLKNVERSWSLFVSHLLYSLCFPCD